MDSATFETAFQSVKQEVTEITRRSLDAPNILGTRLDTPPSMPNLSTAPTLSVEITEAIENRQRLSRMLKEIQAQLDDANDAIKEYMIDAGLTSLQHGDVAVTLSVQDRASLDKRKLLEQGVTTDQIARATVKTTFMKLDVREKKAEK